jgi:curved DNA-binding protein CbpA
VPRPGLPETLAALVEAVRFKSYFDCLGVPPDATTTEVHDAYRRRVAELDAARPVAGLAPEVRDALDEVGPVMEDAFEVLSDPDRRLAYRRALSL